MEKSLGLLEIPWMLRRDWFLLKKMLVSYLGGCFLVKQGLLGKKTPGLTFHEILVWLIGILMGLLAVFTIPNAAQTPLNRIIGPTKTGTFLICVL